MSPESRLYEFKRKLSENLHTQSWLAVRRDTGLSCFVKTASDEGDIHRSEKTELLRRSFQLQSRIKSSHVLTACAASQADGLYAVEYPYLAPERLAPVSPTMLLADSAAQLTRMAIIVDYFHLLGLVHCDLKLDNFRILKQARGERLILVDLDNIRESGDRANHRIFGTVDCIAPEVLNDERVSGVSDLYSLGRSMHQAAKGTSDGLAALVELLTPESPARRPELMLYGLQSAGLITASGYGDAMKTVLAMLLLNAYHSLAASGTLARSDIQQDLFFANRLYSIPEEIGAEIQAVLAEAPGRAFAAARTMLAEGTCARCGEYWHLALSDDTVLRVFRTLSGGAAPAGMIETVAAAGAQRDTGDFSLKEYLIRRAELSSRRAAGGAAPVAELRAMAEAAVALQRPAEACDYLRLAADLAVPGSEEHIRLIPFLFLQLINSGRHDEIGPFVDEAMRWVSESTHPSEYFEIKRQMAVIKGSRAEHDAALEELGEIAARCAEHGLFHLHAKSLSGIANVTLAAGRLNDAVAAYERALAFISAHDLEKEMPHTYLAFAELSFQIGHYDRAVSLAKRAVRQFVGLKRGHLLLFGCNVLAAAHARLGEYGKSDYWAGRFLGLIQKSSGERVYAIYYGQVGWSMMVRGELARAEEALGRHLDIATRDKITTETCSAYKSLAECALYRGDAAKCESMIRRARESLHQASSDVVTPELDLIEALLDYYCRERGDLQRIQSLMISMMARQLRAYASVALFVIMIEADSDMVSRNREALKQMVVEVPKERAPVFRAVHCLSGPCLNDESSVEERIAAAGEAYRHLEAAGQWFLAMITCAAVARMHMTAQQPRLAARFLRQALAIADRLSNRTMAEKYDRRLREGSSLVQERRALVQSFEGIADILGSLGREIDPLPRLLKFAVDAVEAERGVLLVCGREKDDLRVKAFVGCKADDLGDVITFSRNIPRAALSSLQPVFVSDALADDAMSKFQSIVAHNIRSVLCVPIAVEGVARGVIYLDHHTIPALFDEEDLTFVKALAKFASLIFATYDRLRSSRNEAAFLESGLSDLGLGAEFVTRSHTLRRLLSPLPQIAASDAAVLIRGESGTGKEIISYMIHAASARRDGPFIKLNCAAIAATLVESELFGVADRTATGVGARVGKFQAADGGTLFLDEIGDMPLEVQAKVLRVLEYQEFEPVGSNQSVTTDVRFIYATNKDLAELVRIGEFRKDLYYRISGVEIVIPPLRERPDDIEVLCRHFMERFARVTGKAIELSGGALEILEAYHWPGNVRELRNVMERLSLLHPGRTIQATDLPGDMIDSAHRSDPASETAAKAESARLRRALEEHGWNVTAAARAVRLPTTTFRRKMRLYGIRRP